MTIEHAALLITVAIALAYYAWTLSLVEDMTDAAIALLAPAPLSAALILARHARKAAGHREARQIIAAIDARVKARRTAR